MRPNPDLLAPDTLGPPARLDALDERTVVPAMPRRNAPERPVPARCWSIGAQLPLLAAAVSLLGQP
jgi:hypothetical protein